MKTKSLMIIGGAVVIAVLMIYLSKAGFLGGARVMPANSLPSKPKGQAQATAEPPDTERSGAGSGGSTDYRDLSGETTAHRRKDSNRLCPAAQEGHQDRGNG